MHGRNRDINGHPGLDDPHPQSFQLGRSGHGGLGNDRDLFTAGGNILLGIGHDPARDATLDLAHRIFHVLGTDVVSGDNEEVLLSPNDVDVSLVDEAVVAAVVDAVFQHGGGLFGIIAVAVEHGDGGDGAFADPAGFDRLPRVVHDAHGAVVDGSPGGYAHPRL